MADTKAEWRERLLRARRSIDTGARRQAGADVVARLTALTEFIRARSVLLYIPLGAEIDVQAVALVAWRTGKDVYRPTSPDPPPTWTRLDPHRPAPSAASLAALDDAPAAGPAVDRLPGPILLIVPGLGFDEIGGRLGRGRGYYDRAIAALRDTGEVAVVGAAYDAQVVGTLPHDPWDQRIDLLVTERRVLAPKPSRGCDPSHSAREEVRDDR
jgi:5-formyltetrahydrofolate cyclo-ligase